MLRIAFEYDVRHVVCLGAHCDDIEIGCGGTILRLAQEKPGISVTWVVLSSDDTRAREARVSAERFLDGVRDKEIIVERFKDGHFPYLGSELKAYFEQLKGELSPDLVLTHTRGDLHQDHRLVSELTWNTFRKHLILEYEIPKYDADLGSPNLFVPLDERVREHKLEILLESFESQQRKDWFNKETFLALMRLRAIECHADSGYAEAFYARKTVW